MSYKKTPPLRGVQVFLGNTTLEITISYLGIEVDDALELSETIDILFTNNSESMNALCTLESPQLRVSLDT